MIVADLDIARLRRIRAEGYVLERRPEVYVEALARPGRPPKDRP
jgi:hypothetical protein